MPRSIDFPFPRRYNSLRLLWFDYASPYALYFVTIDTDSSRPVFGDIKLAKMVLSALLHSKTEARIRLLAYTLMPDHLHVLGGVKEAGKTLSAALGAFTSFTAQLYWKRSREIVEEQQVCRPSAFVERTDRTEAEPLLAALMEWRAVLRPEAMEIKNWPRVRPEHFLGKRLWHTRFHDHIIRNDADLRGTIGYVAQNPAKRGYVTKPQFYPFTGFGVDATGVGQEGGGH